MQDHRHGPVLRRLDLQRFFAAATQLVAETDPVSDFFVRASVHVDESIAGTRVRGCTVRVNMFVYDTVPIAPQNWMRLKTASGAAFPTLRSPRGRR